MCKKVVFFVFLAALLVFTIPVKAKTPQPPTDPVWQGGKLLVAYISIWPEYEYSTRKPGELNVLVINRYVIDPQSAQFPTRVRIQIPASALAPHVVAVGETIETVSDQNVEFSTSAPQNGWIDILVTTSGPAIQVEYYDYNITRDGDSREYVYEWPGTYTAKSFHLDVRVPLHATNMRSDPDASLAGTDAEGFKFGEMNLPNMTAGKIFRLKINYDRDTDQPSTSFMQVKPSTPLDQPVSGQFSLEPYFPWIVVGLVLGLVAAAAIWYRLSTRGGGHSPRTRKPSAATRKKAEENALQELYCHKCGKRAQPSDRFCRTCGEELRQSES